MENPDTKNFLIGYFGASTGTAAAAIVAAAQRPIENNDSNNVFAVVCRSGIPDLARLDYLPKLKAPTLLFIVGENDNKKVIDLNKEALKQIESL